MDRLQCIRAFLEVAQAKSFTAAAGQLGVSKGTITKYVAALETSLGVQLFNRNSKYVNLTGAGLFLLNGGGRLMDEFEALCSGVQSTASNLGGTIRIGTPPGFGNACLAPAVAAFLQKEPNIKIWLVLEHGEADLLRDGLDISIRIATNPVSSSEISKFLGRSPVRLVASPAYVERCGEPRTPKDLERHNCLLNVRQSTTDTWHFVGPEGSVSVHVNGNLKSDFGSALRLSALQGQGLAVLAGYLIDADIRAGALRPVMPDYKIPDVTVSAVYPTRTHLPARVRLFLDFLKDWVKSETLLTA